MAISRKLAELPSDIGEIHNLSYDRILLICTSSLILFVIVSEADVEEILFWDYVLLHIL